ncbi:MAG: hypothetical protein ACRD4O_13930 [Bryobacteraceae bacterium]
MAENGSSRLVMSTTGEKPAIELSARKVGIFERLDRLEAEFVAEFRMWTRRFDARQESITVLVSSFDRRMGDLENQVAELRDRLK